MSESLPSAVLPPTNQPDSVPDEAWDWKTPLFATVGAFGTYFCMYGFRKPFVAAEYQGLQVGSVGFKELAVTVQILGYMLSKFIGIKVISELNPRYRVRAVLLLMSWAAAALVLFALVPPPWNLSCLFLNGLPLGMMYGLVLGFLEGRRTTEALIAALCASFIMADGVAKSLGAALLQMQVPDLWMPAAAAAISAGPLLLFLWILSRVRRPTPQDIAHRSLRPPISRVERRAFLRRYRLGMSALVVTFLLITILRSIRADFQPEIFRSFGDAVPPSIYMRTEFWVALGVIVINGLCVFIWNNRRAMLVSLGVCFAGLAAIPVALVAVQAGGLSPFGFMVLIGLGLYLPYVAFHTAVFERLIAATREPVNLGFLMYVADSIGYLGYVLVMLTRSFFAKTDDFQSFFIWACWVISLVASASLCLATIYFARRLVR